MSLYSIIVPQAVVEQCRGVRGQLHNEPQDNDQRATDVAMRELALCGVVQVAEHRLGNRDVRVNRSTLRARAQHYTDHESVVRALNNCRYYEVVVANQSTSDRYARRFLSGASLVAIDRQRAASVVTDHSPVVVVVATSDVPTSEAEARRRRYERASSTTQLPLGAEAMHGVSPTTRRLHELVATREDKTKGADRRGRRGRAVAKLEEEFGMAVDSVAVKVNRKRGAAAAASAADEAEEVDDDDIADDGDEEPAGGISLEDFDDDDDDDDDDEDEDDDFIVDDDEGVSDNDKESDDDDGDDDDDDALEERASKRRRRGKKSGDDDDDDALEERASKRRRRGKKSRSVNVPSIENVSDTSDDDFEAPSNRQPMAAAPVVDSVAKPPSLADTNPVPEFDGRCVLYETGTIELHNGTTMEADHTYTVDGHVGFTSTTTDLGTYFSGFDGPAVAARMVSSRGWPSKRDYYEECRSVASARLRNDTEWHEETQSWSDADRLLAEAFSHQKITFDVFVESLSTETPANVERAQRWRALFDHAQAKHVVEMWDRWRDQGTEMHERIEFFFDTGHPEVTRADLECLRDDGKDVAIGQFLRWYDGWLVPRGYEPFRMELRVFCEEMHICGSIDALFRHRDTGELIMVDWKRSRGIARTGHERVPRAEPSADGELFEWRKDDDRLPPWTKNCTGIMSERYDDKYTKYFAQQSVYRWLIERYSSLRIARHYLLVCHPVQGDRYDLIPLEYDAALIDAYHDDRVRRLAAEKDVVMDDVPDSVPAADDDTTIESYEAMD